MANYTFFDRVMHRLALQSSSVAELWYDIDQKSLAFDQTARLDQRHVYVSGLARAGTTILMRRFHETAEFRSLTYRDMPFVLAPNIWRRLIGTSKRAIDTHERAHADGIQVNLDSPESLEEPFWRVFSGDAYLKPTHLEAHDCPEEVVLKYRKYVAAILNCADTPAIRYLCKNNNNILRLRTIRACFPNALILIPFRAPLSHAISLLRQHRNFSKSQKEDPFIKQYMTWLGHHEFGQDHRPFIFQSEQDEELTRFPTDNINYWLLIWRNTYRWLTTSIPKDAVFVCYEDLCENPSVWEALVDLAGLKINDRVQNEFRIANKPENISTDGDLLKECEGLYDELRNL